MSEQDFGNPPETGVNNAAQGETTPPSQHEAPRVATVNVLELLESIDNGLKKLDYSNSEFFSQIPANIRDIATGLQSLTSFQADQSRRMRRFEEGYDYQIFKNFTKQIVREVFSLENLLAQTTDEDKKTLIQDSIDSLVELLDRNSVTQIIPETGTPYAGQEKTIECAPVKVFTEDIALNGRIAAVVHTGFLYEFNDGSSRVIAPAKVLLFSNNKEQCSETTACTLALTDKVKGDIQRLTSIFDVGRSTSGNPGRFILAFFIVLLLISSTVLGFVVYHQSQVIQDLLSRQQDNSPQVIRQVRERKSDPCSDRQSTLSGVQKPTLTVVDQPRKNPKSTTPPPKATPPVKKPTPEPQIGAGSSGAGKKTQQKK